MLQTGDLLKHKIQCRPDRSSLVQQHILEGITVHIRKLELSNPIQPNMTITLF